MSEKSERAVDDDEVATDEEGERKTEERQPKRRRRATAAAKRKNAKSPSPARAKAAAANAGKGKTKGTKKAASSNAASRRGSRRRGKATPMVDTEEAKSDEGEPVEASDDDAIDFDSIIGNDTDGEDQADSVPANSGTMSDDCDNTDSVCEASSSSSGSSNGRRHGPAKVLDSGLFVEVLDPEIRGRDALDFLERSRDGGVVSVYTARECYGRNDSDKVVCSILDSIVRDTPTVVRCKSSADAIASAASVSKHKLACYKVDVSRFQVVLIRKQGTSSECAPVRVYNLDLSKASGLLGIMAKCQSPKAALDVHVYDLDRSLKDGAVMSFSEPEGKWSIIVTAHTEAMARCTVTRFIQEKMPGDFQPSDLIGPAVFTDLNRFVGEVIVRK